MTKDGARSTSHEPGGVTVTEVLIVVAILMALAAISLVSLPRWASNQRLKSVSRDLVTHFQYARLEAVKRNSNISFTFNTGDDVGQDGYRIFLDYGSGGTSPGNRIQDSEQDEITLINIAMPNDVTLEDTTFTDNGLGMNAFGYNTRGFPVDSSFTDNQGVVTLLNVERCYQVILRRTSGGLKLEGPKPKDECP